MAAGSLALLDGGEGRGVGERCTSASPSQTPPPLLKRRPSPALRPPQCGELEATAKANKLLRTAGRRQDGARSRRIPPWERSRAGSPGPCGRALRAEIRNVSSAGTQHSVEGRGIHFTVPRAPPTERARSHASTHGGARDQTARPTNGGRGRGRRAPA